MIGFTEITEIVRFFKCMPWKKPMENEIQMDIKAQNSNIRQLKTTCIMYKSGNATVSQILFFMYMGIKYCTKFIQCNL